MSNIRVEKDADDIVTLTWDMPGRSMNVLSEDSIAEYSAAALAAIADQSVKGVVVTSGKPAFIAGADLAMLEKQTGAASNAKPCARSVWNSAAATVSAGAIFLLVLCLSRRAGCASATRS